MNAEQERAAFMRKMADWDDTNLNAWRARRWQFLSETIGVPRDPRRGWNNSFYRALYSRSLSSSDFNLIVKNLASDKVIEDPFVPSICRPKGLAMWDSVYRLSDPKLREKRLVEVRNMPTIINRNRAWIDQIHPALGRCGPLGPHGEIVRPCGPWIFDLTAMPDGWRILEAAHVLTHLCMDQALANEKPSKTTMFPLAATFRRILAEIIVAYAFHLPLNIAGVKDGCTSLLPFGLTVAPTVHIDNPVLVVPFENPGALVVDSTLAVVNIAMLIGPQPDAFAYGTQVSAADRWCCVPSLVIITGWETVDVISHWLMATYDLAKGAPVLMGMSVDDLLPPDQLWAYLALGYRQRALPSSGNGWLYLNEWMASDEYVQTYMATPPLPCQLCMDINKRTENAPIRPPHFPRERFGCKDKDWEKYRSDVKRICKIIDTATAMFEASVFTGPAETRRIRAQRRRGYAAKMTELTDRAWIKSVMMCGGPSHITAKQERRFNELLRLHPDF